MLSIKEQNKAIYDILYDLSVNDTDCMQCEKYYSETNYCDTHCHYNDRFKLRKELDKDLKEKVKEIRSVILNKEQK